MPSDENHTANPSINATCPPEDDRSSWRRAEMDHTSEEGIEVAPEAYQQPTPPPTDSHVPGSTETHIANGEDVKRLDIEEETNAGPDMLSPMSTDADNKQEESEMPALARTDLSSPSMGYDFSNVRVRHLSSPMVLDDLVY